MTEPLEHHVYFAVFGFEDPHREISLLTGMEPDDIWVRGEPYSDLLPEARRMENRWIISSGLDRHASHRDHFERLLHRLETVGPALDEIRGRYRCGIGVSQYFFMDDPWFYLPAELIQRYETLGLALSFDQLNLDA